MTAIGGRWPLDDAVSADEVPGADGPVSGHDDHALAVDTCHPPSVDIDTNARVKAHGGRPEWSSSDAVRIGEPATGASAR